MWKPEHYLARELYRRVQQDPAIFEFLQAGSLDGLWYWDIERPEHEWMSPRFKELFGYSDDEIPNTSEWWQENIHPDDLKVALDNFDRHCEDSSHPYDQVVRYRHKDGSTVWVRCRGLAIRDETGKPVRMLGAHTNLTEQMKALEYIEGVFDTVREPLLVLDRDLRICSANRSFYEFFDVTAAQTEGRPLYEMANGQWDTPELREALAEVTRSQKDVVGLELEGEFGNIERHVLLLNAHKMYRPGNQTETILVAIEDITDRRRLEQSLRDSKEELQLQYEAAIRASGQLLYDRDPVTNTVSLKNVEATLGYADREMEGALTHWTELVHPEDRERFSREIERVLLSKEPFFLEYRVRRKDGSYICVEDRGYFCRDARGEIDRMVGFVVDVTEKRTLEQQLRQAQKMEAIGRLAGGIAHDFNNLLTAIIGYSDIVVQNLSDADPMRADVEEVRQAGERAQSLTRQLLSFGRRQILQPEVLDLNATVKNMGGLLRRVIGEDIDLQTRPASDLEPVRFDPSEIEQVIMNLAVNARDAMPAGGSLTIETGNVTLGEDYVRSHPGARSGPHVMLAVSDTGAGMDAETLSHIFEPFFTTKSQGEGTGLGLATVYGIVKQSGGTVWVYSERGRGTTFKVYLPRAEDAEAAAVAPEPKPAPAMGTETILVVEDEKIVRRLITRALERGGYTVLAAGSADEAMQLARSHEGSIHLLLTDVVLPKVSGPELAQELARTKSDLRVLYMSGYTDNAVVRHGVLKEGVDFIQKPFTPAVLLERVREALSRLPA